MKKPKVFIAVYVPYRGLAPQKVRVFDSYEALNLFLCPNTKRMPYRQGWTVLGKDGYSEFAPGLSVESLPE